MGCEVSIQVHPMPNKDDSKIEIEPIDQPRKNKVYPELKRQLSTDSYVTVMIDESDSVRCDESDFV